MKVDPVQLRGRFAPSPTGYLHLGHVLSCAISFAIAKCRGGQQYLRIEDHDGTRCKPEYIEHTLQELGWLGFNFDNFEGSRLPQTYYQSPNHLRYQKAFETLASRGLVYACSCSRRDIQTRQVAQGFVGAYDGHCRDLKLELSTSRSLRLRLPSGKFQFIDLLQGPKEQAQDAHDDLVIRDRHGFWTYQFCVVIDDIAQGINCVARGEDLFSTCAIYLALWKLLTDLPAPRFAHHPLIYGDDGRKLSKRHFSVSISHLRAEGMDSATMLAEAMHGIGWCLNYTRLTIDQVIEMVQERLKI